MRLINADQLIRTVRFLTLRSGEQIEIHYVDADRIENAQTIEAIPLEWIWRYIDRQEKEIREKVWEGLIDEAVFRRMHIRFIQDVIDEWKEGRE